MRPLPAFSLILSLSLACLSAALSDLRLRQSVVPPRHWTNMGRAPSEHVIQLRIALPQSRFSELEQHLAEISDPSHGRYGQHLSKEEVEELVAPHTSSIDAVHGWLASHDIHGDACHQSPAGDWVTVQVPVAQAEKMLGTEFSLWKHDKDGDVLVRTTEYSLPAHLDQHVELIQPTTVFHRAKELRSTLHFSPSAEDSPSFSADGEITIPGSDVSVSASCNSTITVSCLKQLYNMVNYVPQAPDKNAIALTGYQEQFANFADLQKFYADQVPAAVKTPFKGFNVTLINGGLNDQNNPGIEANLDTQFALGISFPTPGTFYSTGGQPSFKPDVDIQTDSNEPYMAWLDFILRQENIPQTISTSYGDEEQTVPKDYAHRVCKGLAQLGARGTSVLFSSGDGGVGGLPGSTTETCVTNDGKNQTSFLPIFPASCPYVTAVGGTTQIPEIAANFSGGGFSDVFPRPKWQDDAVGRFLKLLPNGTYAGLFSPQGRAFPDISAQATNFKIFVNGSSGLISGTSASTPTVAGLVALLNDARLAAGKPSLGFLNPLIYCLNGDGFNDIVTGNAPGCGTPGFNATVGWDPVTGFGTPNFGRLKEIALQQYVKR